MVSTVFFPVIVPPNSGRSVGANLSTNYGILVGAEGTTADRLLEHVRCVSASDSTGSNMLYTVAKC